MLAALKIDVQEHGWGDNPCHDHGVSRDMDMKEFLSTIGGGSVRVKADCRHSLFQPETKEDKASRLKDEKRFKETFDKPRKIPVGVPTRKRVEKLLIAKGFKMYKGDYGSTDLIVRHKSYGKVVIETSGSDRSATLQKALKALSKRYAVTLASGEEGSFSAALFVQPKVGVDYHAKERKGLNRRETVPLAPVLIREDVWQKLLATKIETDWSSEEPATVESTRVRVRKLWDMLQKEYAEVAELRATIEALEDSSSKEGIRLALEAKTRFRRVSMETEDFALQNKVYGLARDPIPFYYSIPFNFRLAAYQASEGLVTEAEVEEYLTTVAETMHVNELLMCVRHTWQPGHREGPQDGMWALHEKVLASFLDVASVKRKAQEEREAAWKALSATKPKKAKKLR